MEIKSHAGASIPFTAISQYDRLLKYESVKGCLCYVILWLYEKDVIVAIPISTLKKMKADGLKSFGIKHLNNEQYPSIIIPSVKKRVFMDSDYSVLINMDGDDIDEEIK